MKYLDQQRLGAMRWQQVRIDGLTRQLEQLDESAPLHARAVLEASLADAQRYLDTLAEAYIGDAR